MRRRHGSRTFPARARPAHRGRLQPGPGQTASRALLLAALAIGPAALAAADPVHRTPPPDATMTRIAVGSCLRQQKPAPTLRAVVASRPDVMLLIGDNVYADTEDAARMRAAYAELAANPDYRALVAAVPVLAVWDDHDYGANDAGAEFPFKRGSREIMLDFFDEPADSPRWARDGVYDARVFGPPGRRVQVILLDTRWFRGPLRRAGKDYVPNDDPGSSMLGEAQWTWLAGQLRVPAEVRILASSIQVVADEHPFEKWANLPRERDRLLRLLGESGANGLVVASGDRHRGELSVLEHPALRYPLYDLTASSLNQPIRGDEPNRFRRGALVATANYGTITIDWDAAPPSLALQLHDEDGRVVVQRVVPLTALRAPGGP